MTQLPKNIFFLEVQAFLLLILQYKILRFKKENQTTNFNDKRSFDFFDFFFRFNFSSKRCWISTTMKQQMFFKILMEKYFFNSVICLNDFMKSDNLATTEKIRNQIPREIEHCQQVDETLFSTIIGSRRRLHFFSK